MIVYRAIRPMNQNWWNIECFDREFQISYNYTTDIASMEFADKKGAERYIKHNILKDTVADPYDHGEFGDWIVPNGTF